jgi:hypothetical protein
MKSSLSYLFIAMLFYKLCMSYCTIMHCISVQFRKSTTSTNKPRLTNLLGVIPYYDIHIFHSFIEFFYHFASKRIVS